ncbi:MAG: fructose 1,6-bisphosphatase, partial [Candidatus Omnitrophica bacterium]|nr:fructose 1,6-bisphosphatase [Candidatus Omnitrophota bacterium]
PPAYKYRELLAKFLASVMRDHPKDQPYVTPKAAQEQVAPIRKAQSDLFIAVPKESHPDPFMAEVEGKILKGIYKRITDIKADMGGLWGHTKVPVEMLAVYAASLRAASEAGPLEAAYILGYLKEGRLNEMMNGVGDDGHLLMLNDRSLGSKFTNDLAFTAFIRAYLFFTVNNIDLYGLAQDMAGDEAKEAMKNPYLYAKLDERFFELLKEEMPEDRLKLVDTMYEGWQNWQKSGATVVLEKGFSGNVSGQGMGTADVIVDIAAGERGFTVVAGDKLGPAGMNRQQREGMYAALKAAADYRKGKKIKDPVLREWAKQAAEKYANGLAVEIHDAKAFDESENIPTEEIPQLLEDIKFTVSQLKDKAEQDFVGAAYKDGVLRTDLSEKDKTRVSDLLKKAGLVPNRRIFLDAELDRENIELYLQDSDRFNIKRIWVKKVAGPVMIKTVEDARRILLKPILGSSVTKLGLLAGGEYIGKDDPVSLMDRILGYFVNEFNRKKVSVIQGDMNGSHWVPYICSALKYAVATLVSHPVMVSLDYTISEEGKIIAVKDIYDSPAYDPIRKKAFAFLEKFKKAQLDGQVEPYGTNVGTVEPAYPLAKAIRELNKPDSPYLVKNKLVKKATGVGEEMRALVAAAAGVTYLPVEKDWDGSKEQTKRTYASAVAVQDPALAHQFSDAVVEKAKGSEPLVMLVSAKSVMDNPSVLLVLENFNRQINTRLGIMNNSESIKQNAFKVKLVADTGMTVADVEGKLFPAAKKATGYDASAIKNMFESVVSEADVIANKGFEPASVFAVVGSEKWAAGFTAAFKIYPETTSGLVAMTGKGMIGAIEAVSTADRTLTADLANQLNLVMEATAIVVEGKPVDPAVGDVFAVYQTTMEEVSAEI